MALAASTMSAEAREDQRGPEGAVGEAEEGCEQELVATNRAAVDDAPF